MNKAKILIIEDDIAIADLLSYGLSMEGFQTRTAASGATGMIELKNFNPIFCFSTGCCLTKADWIFAKR